RVTGELDAAALKDPRQVEEFLGFGSVRRTGRVAAGATAHGPAARFRPPAAPAFAPPPATASVIPMRRPEPAAAPAPASPTMETHMTVRRPTLEQMRTLVGGLGMSM